MTTGARSEVYDPKKIGVYHCTSRCVRRAYLCGEDAVTGQSFEHRRGWIRDRLTFLAGIFAIEVFAYAVMSNHLHSLLKGKSSRGKIFDTHRSPKITDNFWRKFTNN